MVKYRRIKYRGPVFEYLYEIVNFDDLNLVSKFEFNFTESVSQDSLHSEKIICIDNKIHCLNRTSLLSFTDLYWKGNFMIRSPVHIIYVNCTFICYI